MSKRAETSRSKQAFAARLTVDALARTFKRELVRLDCGLCSGLDLKPVFDLIYLPSAVALADSLVWLGVPEIGMLRLPFCPDLAGTQIRILLQVLGGISKLLDIRAI